jgi:hypothetical protein
MLCAAAADVGSQQKNSGAWFHEFHERRSILHQGLLQAMYSQSQIIFWGTLINVSNRNI